MLEAKKTGNKLPYPVLITKILEHFHIPRKGEHRITADEASHTFGCSTINHMQLRCVDDVWYPTKVGAMANVEHNPDLTLEERRQMDFHLEQESLRLDDAAAAAERAAKAPWEQVVHLINEFRLEVRDKLESQDKKLDALSDRLTAVEQSLLTPAMSAPPAAGLYDDDEDEASDDTSDPSAD